MSGYKLRRAHEVSVGDFMSVMGAWWEVARIKRTLTDKLEFTLEQDRAIILNPDDMVMLLDL
jgi:hypothetical protein